MVLGTPVDQHGRQLDWVFSEGKVVQLEGLIWLPFSKHAERGGPVDYCELAGEPVPVVHRRVATAIADLASSDIQLFPVVIEGHPEQFCILNVTRVVKCIDDQRSLEVERYGPDCEPTFRDRVGEYRSVIGMRIDPSRVGEAKILRTWGWHVAIIVSAEIKDLLERIGTKGVKFQEV